MKTGLSVLLEAIKDFFLHPILRKVWEGGAEGVAKVASSRLEKKLVAGDRYGFLGFVRLTLRSTDAKAAENILRHQRDRQGAPANGKPYRPGDENKMMNLLSDFWRHSAKKWRKNNTIQLFQWIGQMSDQEFDAFIEALDDDGLEQFIKKAIDAFVRGGKNIASYIKTNWQNADAATADQLRGFNDWLDDSVSTVPYAGTRTLGGAIAAIIAIVAIVGLFAVQAAKLL